MDSSEDECNMNQNSTVDCTKDFADEPELALRGREGVRGGSSGVVTNINQNTNHTL